jgi:hypothetical protein
VRLAGGLPAAAPVPGVRATHAVRSAAEETTPAPGRWLPQGVLLGAALGALLLLGGTVGWLSGRGAEQPAPVLPALPAPSAATPTAVPPADAQVAPEWNGLLDQLDAARAEAFSRGEPTALSAVWAADSPGLASDTRLLQELVDAGRTAHGLRRTVRSVEVLQACEDDCRLRVVDVLAGYEVRDGAGAVVRRTPERGEAVFLVELSRGADGWRLVQVLPEV